MWGYSDENDKNYEGGGRLTAVLLPAMLVLVLVAGLLFPTEAKAASDTLHIGTDIYSLDTSADRLEREGWKWEAGSSTLFLNQNYIGEYIHIDCEKDYSVTINIEGDVEVNGSISHEDAITCYGSLEITGSGTLSLGAPEDNGFGIFALGDIKISGNVGTIAADDVGIYSVGSVLITGSVGDISANGTGIYASEGSVTISGSVGDIIVLGEEYSIGIFAGAGVNITGSVGEINVPNSEFSAIVSLVGDVSISGKVKSINSGNAHIALNDMGLSYAVLDYASAPGDLIDPDVCFYFDIDAYVGELILTGNVDYHTVSFSYLGVTPTSNDVKFAWVSDGGKLPVPSFGEDTWYTDKELTTLYDFNKAVTGDMVLYAGTLNKKYNVISSTGTWTGSGDVQWEIDASFNKFKSLLLDGSTVDGGNYTATEGSTIITLKESYIKTLSDGTHTLRAVFDDGYAELTLTINTDNANDFDDVPKTGDDSITVHKTGIGSSYIFWICVCVAALGLSVTILLKLRKTTARR